MSENTRGAIIDGTKRVVNSEAGKLKTDMLNDVRANLKGVLGDYKVPVPLARQMRSRYTTRYVRRWDQL